MAKLLIFFSPGDGSTTKQFAQAVAGDITPDISVISEVRAYNAEDLGCRHDMA